MVERGVDFIISGYDIEGCKHFKTHGGKFFAQDMTAEIDQMPLNAHASGYVNFILPLNKIAGKLKSVAAALKI